MIVRPYLIARYGVYAAAAVAVLTVWWAHSAGHSLDAAVLRSVFVFVIFVALAFGAEAVLITGPLVRPEQKRAAPEAPAEQPTETGDD